MRRRKRTTHGRGRTERGNRAAHEFRGEEREAFQRWRSAMERLVKTGEDEDIQQRTAASVCVGGGDRVV